MTDVYVYFFIARDSASGGRLISTRRATLDAIKDNGEPLMETQLVADHTELDSHGFLSDGVANDAHPIDVLNKEIQSLGMRADSRDREAFQLGVSAGESRYMLELESRELRRQAKCLQKESIEYKQGPAA